MMNLEPLAFVFPGQGSQFPGMASELYATSGIVRAVFEEASAALDVDMRRLCFEGPKAVLDRPSLARPAVCTVSVAIFRALTAERGVPAPAFLCGHSLGEYAANVAAGVLPLGPTLRALRVMGAAMEEIGGMMAAVIGLTRPQILELCRDASRAGLVMPAAYNGPGEMTLSGDVAAVTHAMALARERGATKVVPLAVQAPCHCPLMSRLDPLLREVLGGLPFGPARVPVISCLGPEIHHGGAYARELLVTQLARPVEWGACVALLLDRGVRTFVEMGPRKLLSGLVARQADGVTAMTVRNTATLAEAAERFRTVAQTEEEPVSAGTPPGR